jgi:hypothetical protein
VELGDEVDVALDKKGRGGFFGLYTRWNVSKQLQMQTDCSTSWVDASIGGMRSRTYQERACQVTGILNLSNQTFVRIIEDVRLVRRRASLTDGTNTSQRNITPSILFGITPSLGTSIYTGYTLKQQKQNVFFPPDRQRELFLRLSFMR